MMSGRSAGVHCRQPQHIPQLLEPGRELPRNRPQCTAIASGAWEIQRPQQLKVMLFLESSGASLL